MLVVSPGSQRDQLKWSYSYGRCRAARQTPWHPETRLRVFPNPRLSDLQRPSDVNGPRLLGTSPACEAGVEAAFEDPLRHPEPSVARMSRMSLAARTTRVPVTSVEELV